MRIPFPIHFFGRRSGVKSTAYALVLCLATALPSFADVRYSRPLVPGTPAETDVLFKNFGSIAADGSRSVSGQGGWMYRFCVPASSRCELRFTVVGSPKIDVFGFDGSPVKSRIEMGGPLRIVYCTALPNQPLGSAIRFQFHSTGGSFSVRDLSFAVYESDSNRDGLSDALESMMGVAPSQHAQVTPRPTRPQTSFQTGQEFSPTIAIPTDAVLVYSNDSRTIHSWADTGRVIQTMGGFREGIDYVNAHPDEVQKDAAGTPISIGGNSYYMIPTVSRNLKAIDYYRAALGAGSTAVCPEEPEIWTAAGYSDAFKQEWQFRYQSPWQAPLSGIDARYNSEQLKAFLTTRQVGSILDAAKEIRPSATRMLAIHSPVTHYQWNIPMPHYGLLKLPSLQEIIGQVWTGTARTAARSGGVRAERTFEVGYLEYSSLYNLARGTGKRMWFLMNPLEDNPNLPLEDYHRNYEQTLAAALLFPDIDSYEVMPWPQRIYGRVSEKYETEINTVVGALSEMWRYPHGEVDAGSTGIGTFVADSMGWQRGEPSPSDYDGFYGLSLPLVTHGVPLDVLSLDRVTEPGFLDHMKVLLLSYDFLKPPIKDVNTVLASWVRNGGTLLVFGGTDAYNEVKDSWWRNAALSSPVEDLFDQLGLKTSGGVRSKTAGSTDQNKESSSDFKVLLKSENGGASNRRQYAIDLTPYANELGSVSVRFEDITPQDGQGPMVYSAELTIGGKLAASFRTGSELETRFLEEEHGSKCNGEGRFADKDAYWTYRFDNLPRGAAVKLTVDMANGFMVKARQSQPRAVTLHSKVKVGAALETIRIRGGYPITLFKAPPGAEILYEMEGDAPPVWESRIGNGTLTYVGIAPGYMSASSQSSRWLRALVERSYEKSGLKYRESRLFLVKRGPYIMARALGKDQPLDGNFVDLLDPDLPFVDDPVVPARGCRFLISAGPLKGSPRILAVSGRARAKYETRDETSFLAESPSGTNGAARIWAGKRIAAGVKAFDVFGTPVPASFEQNDESVLVRYPNKAEGVAVRVGWK